MATGKGLEMDRFTKEELYNLAFFEEVTQYYNWSWMREKLVNFDRYGIDNYVFVHFDIKDFKMINEIYGHEAGDNVLRRVCRVMQQCDWAYFSCRCDNDNFAMMMKCCPPDEIRRLLTEMFGQVSSLEEDASYPLYFRCGVAAINNAGEYGALITDMAKLAQHLGVSANVTEINFYTDEMKEEQLKGKLIKKDLPRALEEKELLVYYQPKYDPSNNSVVGAEALIRWNLHHEKLISPGLFVPYLEKEGAIDIVDRFVLEQVCIKLEEWKKKGMKLVPISVNMSKAQLYSPVMLQNIMAIVDKYDVERKYIEFELTESLTYDDEFYMLHVMEELRRLGFMLSIDDFGTGYSSLRLLSSLPLTTLKIDKSFIDEIENEASSRVRSIVQDILNMTQHLKITSVAEGVETEGQKDLVEVWGCDYIQGYYYSKPLPVEEFEKKLIEN